MGKTKQQAEPNVTECANPFRESRQSCESEPDQTAPHGHISNPCRDSYMSELDGEDVKRWSRRSRLAPERSTSANKRAGALASIVLTGVVAALKFGWERANETVPCGPLILGPQHDVGNCHSVNPGATCDVYCSVGYEKHGARRVRSSATFTCPQNNRDAESPPIGTAHGCVDIDECASAPCEDGHVCLESGTSAVAVGDYLCGCSDGFFVASDSTCSPCTVCSAGELPASECNSTADTVCELDGGFALRQCFDREARANDTMHADRQVRLSVSLCLSRSLSVSLFFCLKVSLSSLCLRVSDRRIHRTWRIGTSTTRSSCGCFTVRYRRYHTLVSPVTPRLEVRNLTISFEKI